MGKTVVIAVPSLPNPFTDASEISITGEDRGRVTLANGLARHGEEVRRIRASNGEVAEVWIGDARFLPEREAAAELEQRYGG
jgi:D-alanyl-D-alanine carboxypeptidase